MIRWIVASSLRFRYLVIALGIGLLVFGAQQIRGMPVEAFPEFAPPRVEVQTICLGLNATEVEELVSTPLEESLTGLGGLDVIRSKSVPQLSSIELRFQAGHRSSPRAPVGAGARGGGDPSLPTWAAPPVILPAVSSTARVMAIGVTSKTLPATALSSTAYWKIRARLLRVPGVANVSIWGEHLEQLHVQVDPARMQRHGVTLQQAMTATSDAFDVGLLGFDEGNRIGAGGYVETPNQRLAVEHVLSVVTPDDLARSRSRSRAGSRASRRRRQRPHRHAAAHRRRGRQRGTGPAAHRREVPVGEHARHHPRRRFDDPRDPARAPRHRVRHAHLPDCRFHRDVDPQPRAGDADRRIADRLRARRLPVRVAHRRDQPGGDAALRGRGAPRAPRARRDDQRDGPGGTGDLARGGRRRRDHRHRERLAPTAPEPRSRAGAHRRPESCWRPRWRCAARSSTRR